MKRLIGLCFFCCVAFFVYGQASVDSLLDKANKFYKTRDYEKAQATYLEIIKRVDESKNPILILKAYNGVARSLYRFYDREGALKWLNKSIRLIEKYQIDTLRDDIYYNTAVMYVELGKIDSAEKYNAKAVQIWKDKKNYSRLSQAQSVMADLYLNAGKNFIKAEKYITEAEKNALLSGDKNCIAFAAMKRYFLLTKAKYDHQSALKYVKKAEKLYREIGDLEGINYALSFKAMCLAKLKDTTAADYFMDWFKFKDSVFTQEKAQSIIKYESLYRIAQKEKENKLLNEQAKNQRLIIILMVIAILGLLALYQLISWQRKQKITLLELKALQKEKEISEKIYKEKERISRDLHDNVGAQLSFLITNIDWILKYSNSIEDDTNFKTRLKSLSETGKSASYMLRETVWAISNQSFYVEDLADRFKQYTMKIMEFNTETSVKFKEELKENSELSPISALNLFRICQETFHNALKHSNCKKITISLNNDKEKLTYVIEDDGKGFDTNKQVKGHYGLINMQSRAKEIGADIKIESQLNKGTKVVVDLMYPPQKAD